MTLFDKIGVIVALIYTIGSLLVLIMWFAIAVLTDDERGKNDPL